MCLPAEVVAQLGSEGEYLAALKAYAESLCTRMHLLAVLDTLEYLQRGGRIGPAGALLGTMLKMKPLPEGRDGQGLPGDNVRTRSKAHERLGQLVAALGELEAVAHRETQPPAWRRTP